jgi:RNA polymerase sigma-70 factor (ECF subfamily)
MLETLYPPAIPTGVDFHIDNVAPRVINAKEPMGTELTTRKSLLSRLRKANEDADWQHLYDQYRGVILSFCRKQGIDDFSADDVLQETFILLMRKLPSFQYDPARGKFRNWLLQLVAGKIKDARKRAWRARLISLEDLELGESCGNDEEVTESVDRAWRQAVMEEALRRIKADPRTKPQTFLIFQSYAMKGASVCQVAREFDVEENVVYQIKNRMLRRLAIEMANLERKQAFRSAEPWNEKITQT